MFCQHLPHESSFWRSPRSCHSERSEESPYLPLFVFVRHSGAAPGVVILSAAKNPRICLCLFVILAKGRISVVALLRRCTSEFRCKPHRINILPATAMQ